MVGGAKATEKNQEESGHQSEQGTENKASDETLE